MEGGKFLKKGRKKSAIISEKVTSSKPMSPGSGRVRGATEEQKHPTMKSEGESRGK